MKMKMKIIVLFVCVVISAFCYSLILKIIVFNKTIIELYSHELVEKKHKLNYVISYAKSINMNNDDIIFMSASANLKRKNWEKTPVEKTLISISPRLIIKLEYNRDIEFQYKYRNVFLYKTSLVYFYASNPDLEKIYPGIPVYHGENSHFGMGEWIYVVDKHWIIKVSENGNPYKNFMIFIIGWLVVSMVLFFLVNSIIKYITKALQEQEKLEEKKKEIRNRKRY